MYVLVCAAYTRTLTMCVCVCVYIECACVCPTRGPDVYGLTHPANTDEKRYNNTRTLSHNRSCSHARMVEAGAYDDDEEEAEAGDAGQKRGDGDRDAGTILKSSIHVPSIVNTLGH